MLLRIENNGRTPIGYDDYGVMRDNPVGLEVRFPGRRVTGMALTDLTPKDLDLGMRGQDAKTTSAIGKRNETMDGRTVGIVELPRVKMNRGNHDKVLVSLENTDGTPLPPEVVGRIGGGTFRSTKNRTGPSRRGIALVAFLSLAIVAQQTVALTTSDAAVDCAEGNPLVTGSTAFKSILEDAAGATRRPVRTRTSKSGSTAVRLVSSC